MPALTWEDTYSVGFARIDDEHKVLIELINNAHSAVFEGKDKTLVAKVVADMKQYAQTHFATEEQLMDKYNYPEVASHKSQHIYFKTKSQILDSMVAGGEEAPDPLYVFQFLSQWLIDHILESDKKLGTFLSEQGDITK